MIKMLVVPMVFFSITAGVASLGDLRKLRNIGVKVVGLYAITSAISVGIGLLVANMINPGKGFDMTALSGAAEYEAQGMPSVLDTLIDSVSHQCGAGPLPTRICSRLLFSPSFWAWP